MNLTYRHILALKDKYGPLTKLRVIVSPVGDLELVSDYNMQNRFAVNRATGERFFMGCLYTVDPSQKVDVIVEVVTDGATRK